MASTTIARLAVDFVANTAKFSKGVKRAQSDLNRFGSTVAAASRRMLGYGSVLTSVAGAGGLGVLMAQQSEAIDVMSKFSKQTGIATETLAGLSVAADLSGVDSEKLNKGVSKLAIALGRVRQGATGAEAPFARIGLDAQKLANMPLSQSIGIVADAINALPTPMDRAAAAMAIFGKSGVELLPFLANGSKGMAAAAAEAKKFGLAFSGIDGTKVEEMNDAWTRTLNLFKGIARQIVINIAPAIQAALESFTSFATQGDIAETVKRAVHSAVEWIDFLAARAKVGFLAIKLGGQLAWATILNAAEGAVKGMAKLLNYVTGEIKRVVDGVNKVSGIVGIKPIDFTATSYDTSKIDMGGKASAAAAVGTAKELRDASMNADSVGFTKWFDRVTDAANKAAGSATAKGSLFDPDMIDQANEKLKDSAGLATDAGKAALGAGSGVGTQSTPTKPNTGTFGQGSLATMALGGAGRPAAFARNSNVTPVRVNGLNRGANDTQQAMILRQILIAIQRGNYPGRTNAAYAG